MADEGGGGVSSLDRLVVPRSVSALGLARSSAGQIGAPFSPPRGLPLLVITLETNEQLGHTGLPVGSKGTYRYNRPATEAEQPISEYRISRNPTSARWMSCNAPRLVQHSRLHRDAGGDPEHRLIDVTE